MKPAGAWPRPLLSALVAASWLLLNQSLALAQLITATVLAWGLPQLLHGFLGPAARVHAWGTVLRLTGVVLWDIVLSNFTVTPGSMVRSVLPLIVKFPSTRYGLFAFVHVVFAAILPLTCLP